jgi:hypothetical protein
MIKYGLYKENGCTQSVTKKFSIIFFDKHNVLIEYACNNIKKPIKYKKNLRKLHFADLFRATAYNKSN